MKKLSIFLALLIGLTGCSNFIQEIATTSCTPDTPLGTFSNSSEVINVLNRMVAKGIPGISIGIQSSEGYWEHSVGYAKLEDQVPMETCHLIYLQSISKLYFGTAALKLKEQGRIDLDLPITEYLSAKYAQYVQRASEISVRMLLNHTSGIPEYNDRPAYVAFLLQNPDHTFSPEDYLEFVGKLPLDFEPGSKFSYRNTNYLILALIMESITGDHAAYIRNEIFDPLGLRNTLYREKSDYLNDDRLINSYWDRYSDGIIENVSELQRTNVASLIGDDGIVTTPKDAIAFLRGLMETRLISQQSLEEMMEWVPRPDDTPAYGLGLDYTVFVDKYIGYGHGGGGIGGGAELYYFPEQDVYFCIGINLGIVTEGPLNKEIEPLLDELYAAILG